MSQTIGLLKNNLTFIFINNVKLTFPIMKVKQKCSSISWNKTSLRSKTPHLVKLTKFKTKKKKKKRKHDINSNTLIGFYLDNLNFDKNKEIK